MDHLKLIDIIYELSDKCSGHRNRHLRELKLSNAEFKGLICMVERREITCKEFSEKMGLSISRGSRVIDRLYKRKYIQRTDSDADRRCRMIQLTETGKGIRDRIEKEKSKCEKDLIAAFPEKKVNQLKMDLMDLISKL